jgi:hypothetical protein
MELRLTARPEVVKDYFRLFVNRRAYTMQSMRPNPETGRHYYFRPTGKCGAPPSLTQETNRCHLEGRSRSDSMPSMRTSSGADARSIRLQQSAQRWRLFMEAEASIALDNPNKHKKAGAES